MKNKLLFTVLCTLAFQDTFCMELHTKDTKEESSNFAELSTDELPYCIFDTLTKRTSQGTHKKTITNLKKDIENTYTLAPLRRVCKRFAQLIKNYLQEGNDPSIVSLAKKYNITERAVILHIVNIIPSLKEKALVFKDKLIIGITALTTLSPLLKLDEKDILLNLPPANATLDLREPAKAGDLEKVKSLIQQNADVNKAVMPSFYTPLMWATLNNRTEIVQELIMAGADPNIQSYHGTTALIIASKNGFIDIVKLLLEAGADISIRERAGNQCNVLEYAQANGHTEIAELLKNTDSSRKAFGCTIQ